MENEFQILDTIEKNKNATQRDIAKSTGMSLGSVNVLIKRLVKKGLLKSERLNPKTIRYILTHQGMKEKAAATYNYVVASYRFVNDINSKIDELIANHSLSSHDRVLLFGYHDEICELMENKLRQKSIQYKSVESVNEFITVYSQLSTILVWHPDFLSILSDRGIICTNVLDRIVVEKRPGVDGILRLE